MPGIFIEVEAEGFFSSGRAYPPKRGLPPGLNSSFCLFQMSEAGRNTGSGYGYYCGQRDPEFSHLQSLDVACRRMILPTSEYKRISKGRIIAEYLWSGVRVESKNSKYVVLRTGDCHWKTGLDLSKLSLGVGDQPEPILAEWHLAERQNEPSELTPMAKLWRDLLADPVMPYDPAERRKKFPKAFAALRDYIEAHEHLARKDLELKQSKH